MGKDMSGFKFTPSDNYDLLLKQANSMAQLIRSLEAQRSIHNIKISDLEKEISGLSKSEINAERETNSILTDTIDSLEKKVTTYRNALEIIASPKSDFDNATTEMERDGLVLVAIIALDI